MVLARADMADIGTRVYDRVRATAKAAKQDVQFAFQRFALERLLARLETTRFAGAYAVKGGMLMLCLPGGINRTTDDLDLSSSVNMGFEELKLVIREVCAVDPSEEDGLTFVLDEGKTRVLMVESPHPTVRLMVDAKLHSRYGGVPIRLMLDVSQGEGIYPGLSRIRLPQSCKGFEPPEVTCYPWETVVAEKLDAIIGRGATNTRMKDFYDLVSISRNMDLSLERLAEAVVVTFGITGRRIDPEPYGFTDSFAETKERDWKAFTKNRRLVHAPVTMAETVAAVRAFACPVLVAAMSRAMDASRQDTEPPF